MSWKPIDDSCKDGKFYFLNAKGWDVPQAMRFERKVECGFSKPKDIFLSYDGHYMLAPPTHYMDIPEL